MRVRATRLRAARGMRSGCLSGESAAYPRTHTASVCCLPETLGRGAQRRVAVSSSAGVYTSRNWRVHDLCTWCMYVCMIT